MERVEQWDEIYDKRSIHSLDELQILEVADDFKVPPSWIRENMSRWEIMQWADYQRIKNDRQDQAMKDAKRVS